jgi:RNA polymerase sigma-70 factor (ECF subfamily)
LYAIATNTCLDHLRRGRRRALPYQLQRPGETDAPEYPDVAWLQPYPDALLEEADPESLMIAKETVSLAFLAAIQLLTPRQRAVLLLREVSGWTGPEIAAALDCSVAAVDSALQRARASLKRNTPDDRPTGPCNRRRRRRTGCSGATSLPTEAADVDALARFSARRHGALPMPPRAVWFEGRDAVVAEFRRGWGRDRQVIGGSCLLAPTGASGGRLSELGETASSKLRVRRPGTVWRRDLGDHRVRVPRLFPVSGFASTLP